MDSAEIIQIIKDRMKFTGHTYDSLARTVMMTRQSLWMLLNGKQGNIKSNAKGSKSVRVDSITPILDALGLELIVRDKH